ncbi:hypothetical protein ACWPKO_08120 [Coraliomargarita sp. W4R53]
MRDTAKDSKIGSGWTFEANSWGIDNTDTNGRVYTNVRSTRDGGSANAVMWNTNVKMADSAAESSTVSVDVIGDSAKNFFGLAFNVQSSDSFYQFRLKFGTNDYQIIEFTNGTITQTIVNQGNDIAEVFDLTKSYTLTLVSNVNGVAGDYRYTITEAGSATVLNSQTSFSDTTYTGGFAGLTFANSGSIYYYDNFEIKTLRN